MNLSLAFLPDLPWETVAVLATLVALGGLLALWRRLPGWALRSLALGVLVLALAGPHLKREQREGLKNVAFLVVDRSASTGLEERAAQIEAAAAALAARIEALSTPTDPLELRVVEVPSAPGGDADGTRLLGALDEAAAGVAERQIAGAVLLTDGQAHDADRLATFPAPVHVLLAGGRDRFDLALDAVATPAFGIVGDSVTFAVRVRAEGRGAPAGPVAVEVAVDGGAPRRELLQIGAEGRIEVAVAHGGPNVVDIRLPPVPGELTARNNRILATVNGVRDRLRVLLVSGEPYPGGRTWRDLLKSDPTVDLIHFTILRPPSKQDATPVQELSLIAFPTRELFLDKIDSFDLIVFDRYRWRGVLAAAYLANIVRYVRDGGAVLIVSGPSFAGAQSLSRTPLNEVLPAEPTFDVHEKPFLPRVSSLGGRHPVTAGLEESVGRDARGPRWGRWLRQVEVQPVSGQVLMEGYRGLPLLILDRVGEGRIALLASDQIWLWTRGFEGGGPQAELLRRLAHWLMREPELEEEALEARVEGDRVLLERRTLAEEPPGPATAIPPDGGAPRELAWEQVSSGRWQALLAGAAEGLWRFTDGTREAVAAVGPPSPREFLTPLATAARLEPLAEASGGRVHWLADGIPDVRRVGERRRAHGRGWIGVERRDAYRVTGLELTPLLPPWLAVLTVALVLLVAWRRESR